MRVIIPLLPSLERIPCRGILVFKAKKKIIKPLHCAIVNTVMTSDV